jgi:hypothetical protein
MRGLEQVGGIERVFEQIRRIRHLNLSGCRGLNFQWTPARCSGLDISLSFHLAMGDDARLDTQETELFWNQGLAPIFPDFVPGSTLAWEDTTWASSSEG